MSATCVDGVGEAVPVILKVVDDVELLDSARAEVLVGTGVDVA